MDCAPLGGVATRTVQFCVFFVEKQQGAAAVAAAAAPPSPPQPPPSPSDPAVPSNSFRFRADAELEFHAMAALNALAVGSLGVMARLCVDCGQRSRME